MNIIFCSALIITVGIWLAAFGIMGEMNKKINVPDEGISYMDFYDHRDDGIYHAKIVSIGKGLNRLDTKNASNKP